jgi:hypothetical protein
LHLGAGELRHQGDQTAREILLSEVGRRRPLKAPIIAGGVDALRSFQASTTSTEAVRAASNF